ncbi:MULTISPECIES: hypothetical protein [Bacillus cereus group]|uniref:Uncharacterized protein n=2 Tax=Bacillus cereus group TaxID=86661 RepID=A0A9W5KS88_BACCE|nr:MULTISPECIES: hypothetical protein [Bacillus cereus group]MEB8733064.1 hypothetical protein [Bacillus cereus]EJR67250.1 hypothetical protein IK5_05314 [Bacillus cereus VD154]KIU73108.1 hypothetical protein C797_19609 [Bacillus thuringiensis Sbt003]MEB8751775.1 hypothetical protein [Bacillus cereus]MEB8764292.1 hypothetical protein [Bacillus cereus]
MGEKRIVVFIEKNKKELYEHWGIQLSEVQKQIIQHTLQITNESHLHTLERYTYKLKQAERSN